jgi:hypothetical protein
MAKSLSRKRLTLKSLKRKGDRDKDDDHCGKGLSKKLRQLQAGLSSLQTQVNTIELTPGFQDPAGQLGQQVLTDKTVQLERKTQQAPQGLTEPTGLMAQKER